MKPRKSGTDVKKSSRRRKNNNLDLFDWISVLPDSILGSILSFLPTKEAVATAILSKRWKFVWRNVYNIDFSFDDCVKSYQFEDGNTKFIRFVDRVLLLLDVGFLNKFTLEWDPGCIPSSHVNSWISTAVTRNIHELYLCTPYAFPYDFDLPTSVISCESIRSLELNGIYVPTIDVVCLPRLENLKLYYSGFDREEDFETLISKCPVLSYLHMDMIDDGFSDEFTYMISSTSLKRLVLSFDSEINDENLDRNVKLKASSLEYLKLEGFVSGISVQKKLSSLIEADFKIKLFEDDFPSEEICNSIVEAVDAFDCVKVLTLSSDTTWALSCATINLSTVFTRLMKLEITTYCCYRSSLQNLIQNSNNLEVLTIYQCSEFKDRINHHDHLTWKAPVEVPRCLSNNLKKIVLDCYYDYDDLREMIRYMLKHGSVLEVIQIFCCRHTLVSKKLELVLEICKFPRKSPSCEVEFSYTDWSKMV